MRIALSYVPTNIVKSIIELKVDVIVWLFYEGRGWKDFLAVFLIQKSKKNCLKCTDIGNIIHINIITNPCPIYTIICSRSCICVSCLKWKELKFNLIYFLTFSFSADLRRATVLFATCIFYLLKEYSLYILINFSKLIIFLKA